MDFVVSLLKNLGKFDIICIVVDRLTKQTHFIPIRVDFNEDKLAKIYVKEIVTLHGVQLSVISYRGTLLTFMFWRNLYNELVTQLTFSTTFHHQMDGQLQRTIHVLENM